jgi:hypothetical protein
MITRERVRSGRRENFYITDNSFIDHYAKEAGLVGVAVYHVLERYMNCGTKSTYVGTAKVAELLDVSQRTVQRSLKTLEDLKLIRIVRTSTMTTYYIEPVPPRAKTVSAPLFDKLNEEEALSATDTPVAWATPTSRQATSGSRAATSASQPNDTSDASYKEEQNLLNKTEEQENTELNKAALCIVNALKLPDTFITAATAAVQVQLKRTRLSMDGIVNEIATAAHQAYRRGIEADKFLEGFLAQTSAEQIVQELHLPATSSLISTVAAAIKAEVTYTRLSVEEVAVLITNSALDDMRGGIAIDRFYFEGVKWRTRNGNGKHKQRSQERLQQELDILHSRVE